jgi:deoxyribodipyrimidine photo-lyase
MASGMQPSVVWFKRDLRIADHSPLVHAVSGGPVIPLMVIEPDLWNQPDSSYRQYSFMRECALELDDALAGCGARLVIRVGHMIDVLAELKRQYGVAELWSHEETGNALTYERDIAVGAWCRENGVIWRELPQNGVVRRLRNRDGWAKRWDRLMAKPTLPAPERIQAVAGIGSGALPTPEAIGLAFDGCTRRQPGGRRSGLEVLQSFLHARGKPYRRAMSSPLAGAEACSRLSPHLAWGALSMREVMQATWRR